jgi:hypothetical protein
MALARNDVSAAHGGLAWQEDNMQTRPIWRAVPVAVSAAMVLGGTTLAAAATGQPGHGGAGRSGGIRHVLLISVDGLHQQDLTWYVRNNPHSVLAALDRRDAEYSNARTPFRPPGGGRPGHLLHRR